MKFQFRRFAAGVPWADWTVVLGALLIVVLLMYAMEQHGKSKKRRCPTCNQIVKEAE